MVSAPTLGIIVTMFLQPRGVFVACAGLAQGLPP